MMLAAIGTLAVAGCEDPPSTAPITSASPPQRYMSGGGSTVGSSSAFGINVSTFKTGLGPLPRPWLSDEQMTDQLNAVVDAGAGWIRIPIYWSESGNNGPDAFDVTSNGTDRLIWAARARGLSIYAVIEGTPSWNDNVRFAGPVKPENYVWWELFVSRLVARYDTTVVQYWSIMNEANCPALPGSTTGWSGTQPEYDELFARAAAIIPSGHIALADPIFGNPCTDPVTWLNEKFSGVVTSRAINVPIVSVHSYGDSAQDIIRDVNRAINVSAGRPVWLTEFNTPSSDRWPEDSIRNRIQTRLMGGVLNGMRTTNGWEKSFPYRLWADDSDALVAVLEPTWNGATYPRKDQWHMLRLFANYGTSTEPSYLIPTYRWWRQWDGMVGTNPSEGYALGYMLQSANDWSGSRHAFLGWRPLFRCVVSDPATNNGHYIGTRHTCDERAVGGNRYPRNGTVDESYGHASPFNWPDVGLVRLYRFMNDGLTDYVQTTSASEAATLRSVQNRNNGWREVDTLGYVWPTGFVP